MSTTLKLGAGNWATKAGSLLSYNDENGNFKPLPFNFTRSTSATRVNKDGLIEVVTNNKPRIDFLNNSKGALLLEPSRTNLIQYSKDFGNDYWTKSGASIDGDASTAGADLVGGVDFQVTWNPANITVNSATSLTSTSAGGYIQSHLYITSSSPQMYQVTVVGTYSGAGNLVRFFDYGQSQLYSDVVVSGGVFSSTFYAVATADGFLIQMPDNSATLVFTTFTVKEVQGYSAPSVNFPTSAFKLVENAATSEHRIERRISAVSTNDHTLYVYAKANTRDRITIQNFDNSTQYAGATFDLLNGVIVGDITGSAEIKTMANGWYKCSVTGTPPTTNLGYQEIALAESTHTGSFLDNYLGDGTSGVYIFGAQLEQGSYATSYIPTQGSIGTRTVEYSKILNQPILKATNKFTMFFDAPKFLEVNGGVGSFSGIMLNLGAEESAYSSGGGLHIYNNVWYYFSGSVATHMGICYNSLTDSKFAISYDGTSFHKYANGVKIGSIALSASMVNWGTFQTGDMADGGLNERSWNLKNLKLYNTALTDAELISLTTI